ncbi:MAG: hypothetical protein ACP5GO_00030 [Thermoprotei archaeon]
MVKEVQLSDETYSYLEQIRLQMEAKQGRKLSFDEVIKYLVQGKENETDSMEIIWERLGEIQDTLSDIKEMLSATRAEESASTTRPQVERHEEKYGEADREIHEIEENVPEEEQHITSRPKISIPTSPVHGATRGRPAQQEQERTPESATDRGKSPSDNFINFIKNVGAYPLSRIRKPISQIRDLEEKGIVKIIGEDEDRVLVYRPYYDAIIASLPRTENEVEQLSAPQKKVLDEMHKATLVYKDQNGVWRLTTPSA